MLDSSGRYRWVLIVGALVLSCQGALGIEDLSGDLRPSPPAAGAGGGSGGLGTAGALEQGGSSGSGGIASNLGSDEADAAASLGADLDAGIGGDLGDPGAGDDPAVGSDAGPPDADLVINGRVIDFFRRPVPGVPVSIGDQTDISDADGRFTIAGVTAPYDASLMLQMTRFSAQARYGYVYQGLTRDDPTLQVYSALVQRSATSLLLTLENAEFDADADRRVLFGFNSPDGRYADPSVDVERITILGVPAWTGPAVITGNVHALRVLTSGGFDGDPPLAYEAHQTGSLSASDGELAELTLDMQANLVPTATVAGSVTGGTLGVRSDLVSVRFADGTVVPLIDESSAGADFAYLVPALEQSSITVAAADGVLAPLAVAWRDDVAPGDTDVALAIPNPVALSAPQQGASVTPSTPYSWSVAGQSAQTFLWHLEFSQTYEGMLVITSRTQIELPTFPDGFTVPPGTEFVWSVETHGDAPDVDALAGPDGFLTPFSVGESFPVGPARGSGYYTESARRSASMSSD